MVLRLELERIYALREDAELNECERCEGTTYDRTCLCSPLEVVDPIERLEAEAGDDPEKLKAEFRKLWKARGGGESALQERVDEPKPEGEQGDGHEQGHEPV